MLNNLFIISIMDKKGILDPEGININPLNGKPYSENYKELAKSWTKLPAYKEIDKLIKTFHENQVVLTVFGTGTGKTVINPKALLHVFNYNAKIMISLPKQIIAKSAATYAAATLDVELGKEVGYKYKGSPDNSNSNDTKLLYASDGTIVQKLLRDPYLRAYNAVIVDELHEHKIQIDMLLYLLRETLKKRGDDFKLVLMSATVDTDIYKNYFSDYKFKVLNLEAEKFYNVESKFLANTLDYDNTIKECFKTLIGILENDDPNNKDYSHDIIIFVTSSNDGFKLCRMLGQHLENDKKNGCKITYDGSVFCVEVYSGMDTNKELLATHKFMYREEGNYNRKVVIGTNVMESSLTIDGVKFVIDTGYEFNSSFDPVNSARRLDRILISKAQAIQRMGRAGRTEPGICYHLYSQKDFETGMLAFPEPDILKSDITMECLQLLGTELIPNVAGLLNVLTQFVVSPKEVYVKYSLRVLGDVGAIGDGGVLTPLGELLVKVPDNNLFMSLAILYGKIYNCSRELLRIASVIDVCKANLNELFNIPNMMDYSKEGKDKINKFENVKKKLGNKYGDHLTLLYIYELYTEHKKDQNKFKKWAYDNFIKVKVLNKAAKQYKLAKQQLNVMIPEPEKLDLGIKLFPEVIEMALEDRILFCILSGLSINTGVNKIGTDYYRVRMSDLDKIKIHKTSFLLLKGKKPKDVVYNELFISMGHTELSIVSKIPKNIIKILK